MKKIVLVSSLILTLIVLSVFMTMSLNAASSTATVTKSGNNYIAKVGSTTKSTTTDLATAINAAIGSGNVTVTISCGGSLSKTIVLQSGTTLNFDSSSTVAASVSGYALNAKYKNNISVSGLKLSGKASMGIRFTGCNNMSITNCNISGSGIGLAIRVDTDEKNPWNYSHNTGLTIKNITLNNCSDMGIETYSINNYNIDNITGTNLGSCCVLINDGVSGKIGTVYGKNCCVGGGYAALRFANDCNGCTVSKVTAINCGRGFFTCTNSKNITVNSVDISKCGQGILIQTGSNNIVKSGTVSASADSKGRSVIIQDSPGSSCSGVTVK